MPEDPGYTRDLLRDQGGPSGEQRARREGDPEIELTVRSDIVGQWMVLSIDGELDLYTAPALREAAQSAMEGGASHLILDLSAVQFMDSSGLGVIVACQKRLRETGGQLALVTPPTSPPTKLLSLTGLDRAIATHATLDDATDRRLDGR